MIDGHSIETPCYVVDLGAIRRNLSVLRQVRERTGCRILLALKGFAMFRVFPILRAGLDGTAASSLHEARLGTEEFGGEVHVYAPAYRDDEMDAILSCADHITFNSFRQWQRFRPHVTRCRRPVHCGVRINPRHSEVKTQKYDPCARFSRLGVPLDQFRDQDWNGISGLHFHTLCELNADALERTLEAVDAQFGRYFGRMTWANFGGGHHITRADYDVDTLCRLIARFQRRYDLQVYLEPGEAVALNAGVLVTTVLDVIRNEMDIAILDVSASAHMPDVLEMPYRPEIAGAGAPGQHAHTYRLGGPTCLAGDVIGDYSFSEPLRPGRRLVLQDMAHYTMVKNNTFNGIRLPSIAVYEPEDDRIEVVRRFGYEDYRNRLS